MSIRYWLRQRRMDVRYWLNSQQVKNKGLDKKSREILLSVKDKYKRQRCFVLGNGPSLTPEDLNMLKNEVTIASNRIYKIFERTNWRPTYYTMLDESVALSDGVIENVSKLDCIKFVREQGFFAYKNIKGDVCFIHSKYSRKYLNEPHFSEDLTDCVYTIATVTYMAIQLARWMGCNEIFLLGMDNKYAYTKMRDGTIVRNEGVASYFSDNGLTLPDPSTASATWELDVAYEYADKYSREHGFRIYNATRGGYLETFERVSLDEVLTRQQSS